MPVATNTDPGARAWRIDDEIVQLRAWGSGDPRALGALDELTIGAGDDCALRLVDATGRTSRRHAKLTRIADRWVITDLESKNGIRQDGARRLRFELSPGVEVGIGGITLIPESERLIALRALLARLLGWQAEVRHDVDLALRALRMAATHRDALVLHGEGDLAPIAYQLHRHTVGDERPFVVCDPRRRSQDLGARVVTSFANGVEALAAADGGTLCVRSGRLPSDFPRVAANVHAPARRTQLVVCADAGGGREPRGASRIGLPSLAARPADVPRIIDEYGADAVADLGGELTSADRAWIEQHESTTLAQIDKAARRLVAIRAAAGSITRAAQLLALSHSTMSEWVARRSLPP